LCASYGSVPIASKYEGFQVQGCPTKTSCSGIIKNTLAGFYFPAKTTLALPLKQSHGKINDLIYTKRKNRKERIV
jgi:hypothetical protein